MNEKLIKVYFGSDNLPYKDSERSVHFPIVGGAFLGASNTTKIRFYFDRIGDTAATYVSVAKLPNGKQGSQVLSKSSDSDGNYAELELSNWYTQAKGDVYIALQGYSGGVEYSYDSETELYEIHGTPIIQTTGSIKLAINYAPIGDSADYNDEFTTYQEILAGLGDKVDKKETSGLFAYTHDGSVQGEIGVSKSSVADNIVQRDGQQIAVPLTPSANDNATSKKYVDDSIASAISSVYKYKGSVATYSDLPSSGLTIGDVYNVEETGDNYAWTGTTWDKLAGDIDLSDYATKNYVDTGLSGKQNTLVNQVNIKSINNQSLLGTGNIDIQGGGGGGTWGTITGDIEDQTDLQNELQDIREVAEGKCQTFVLSDRWTKIDGGSIYYYNGQGVESSKPASWFNHFYVYNTTTNDWEDKKTELGNGVYNQQLGNTSFDSQNDRIMLYHNILLSSYPESGGQDVYLLNYQSDLISKGDVFLVIETDVPDRWYGDNGYSFYKLETADLKNYATKTDLANAVADINANLAGLYDNTNTYTIGEIVIHDNKLYRCTTAITTAEDWDSTHWEQINVANGFVNLTGTQTITGVKTMSSVKVGTLQSSNYGRSVMYLSNTDTLFYGSATPMNNTSSNDLGSTANKWRNLYLRGSLGDGNNADYGLILPDTTNFTADKEIATTDQAFNVINASDITNNILTQAQYDLITNGKPTLISGTGVFSGYYNVLIPSFYVPIGYTSLVRNYALSGNDLICIALNPSDKTLSLVGSTTKIGNLRSVWGINGKEIPNYPSNTGTFNIQCVNGTLAWNEQWYGTQAQYDALGTYDSNTIYNILES